MEKQIVVLIINLILYFYNLQDTINCPSRYNPNRIDNFKTYWLGQFLLVINK